MPRQNQYSVSALLNKLYISYNLHDVTDGVRIIIPFKQFYKIMACDEEVEPVISYRRTAVEKYDMLCDFGFIDGQILNIRAIKDKLGRP